MKLALIFVFLITVVPQSPAQASVRTLSAIVPDLGDPETIKKFAPYKKVMWEDNSLNWRLAKRNYRTA